MKAKSLLLPFYIIRHELVEWYNFYMVRYNNWRDRVDLRRAKKLALDWARASRGTRHYVLKTSNGGYRVVTRDSLRREFLLYGNRKADVNIAKILKEAVYYTPEIRLTDAT